MSTNDTSQSPAQFERTELSKLEGLYRELISRIQAFAAEMQTPPSPPLAAAPEVLAAYCFQIARQQEGRIAAFFNELQEWQKSFLTYEPGARYLSDTGLPQLAGRLFEILKDDVGAMQTFYEMHRSAGEHLQALTGIWMQAQSETFKTIQETMANIRKVHEEALKRWSDVTFNKCPYCGLFLSSRIYPLCAYCFRKVDFW
jgi:hypothetical protein